MKTVAVAPAAAAVSAVSAARVIKIERKKVSLKQRVALVDAVVEPFHVKLLDRCWNVKLMNSPTLSTRRRY